MSVEVQYITTDLDDSAVDIVNYLYEIGFMIGCMFSEKYYTSRVQKSAVFICYALTMCSGLSLSIFSILKENNVANAEYIVVAGYGLSGIGQSLLLVVMIAYATPHMKQHPRSVLLPLILGLLNFSAVVGALTNYFVQFFNSYTNVVMLIMDFILLSMSFAISWNLKGIPQAYIKDGELKPEIPFSNFSVTFYSYGVLFGIYSSVLAKFLRKYKTLKFSEEMCIYQGIYSFSYSIGASIIAYIIFNGKKGIIYYLLTLGAIIAGLGLLLNNYEELKNNDEHLWIIDAINSALGISDGIIEPLIIHRIVTRSNRPEFFTGLFYFLASISTIIIISMPSEAINIIYSVFAILIILSAKILNE